MSKTKLLILLLASFFIFSCTKDQSYQSNQKYSLGYIGGEIDGLLLKNYLQSYLKNLGIYSQKSDFEIQANINHTTNLFITNIDNTSNREKIPITLYTKIVNKVSKCEIYNDGISISQFYIYASSDKFLSNQKAVKEIKKQNTEATVKKLVNKLRIIKNECDE